MAYTSSWPQSLQDYASILGEVRTNNRWRILIARLDCKEVHSSWYVSDFRALRCAISVFVRAISVLQNTDTC